MRFIRLFIYFLLVLLIGGLGCWISFAQYLNDRDNVNVFLYIGNLNTFTISVSVMAFVDYLLMSIDTNSSTKALLFFLLMTVAAVVSAFTLFLHNKYMISIAWGALIVAFIEWWLIHWKNPSFEEQINPASALGGSAAP